MADQSGIRDSNQYLDNYSEVEVRWGCLKRYIGTDE